ncbi:ABC-type uncharacterized transport system, substrate-binding protein [Salinihabitans flavidus]|uniref:ABC-type uncharacterized transport system, substrate-binding protein n=1 Tax=Salinihabitans flavidus TaxID=569882 RepID=A0A1H8V426_9RHOB|nr:DUF1007 family protein [Salinihabitans flavidus]SEP10146.1 ABC-type uncharacterized transport system, substrate-binding protein [Salinihabitans flavidus]
MRHCSVIALVAALLAWAGPGLTHPHAFVDVGLRFETGEDGRIAAVEVTWAYDDFFSLLILEDMALDGDGDGALTEAERARLEGFDLDNWPEDYAGDLHLEKAGAPVALGPPRADGVRLAEGRIVSRHRRALETPVAAADLVIRAYDPTYFIAYTLKPHAIELPGACLPEVEPADREAAQERLRDAVEQEEVTEQSYEMLQVGAWYADTVRVTCGG